MPRTEDLARADALYERFHGYPPGELAELDLGRAFDDMILPPMTMLGELESLVYRTRKSFDERALIAYEHRFEPGSYVLAHPSSARARAGVLILAGPFRVLAAGITG